MIAHTLKDMHTHMRLWSPDGAFVSQIIPTAGKLSSFPTSHITTAGCLRMLTFHRVLNRKPVAAKPVVAGGNRPTRAAAAAGGSLLVLSCARLIQP